MPAVFVAADANTGAVESMVTVPVEATDKLPAASTAYALYVPSERPAALRDVAVLADEIVTWFHDASAAPVMFASVFTVTEVFTKYAVPVSVLCTVADPVFASVAVVNVTVGAVESATDTTKLVVTVAPSASAAVRVIVAEPV